MTNQFLNNEMPKADPRRVFGIPETRKKCETSSAGNQLLSKKHVVKQFCIYEAFLVNAGGAMEKEGGNSLAERNIPARFDLLSSLCRIQTSFGTGALRHYPLFARKLFDYNLLAGFGLPQRQSPSNQVKPLILAPLRRGAMALKSSVLKETQSRQAPDPQRLSGEVAQSPTQSSHAVEADEVWFDSVRASLTKESHAKSQLGNICRVMGSATPKRPLASPFEEGGRPRFPGVEAAKNQTSSDQIKPTKTNSRHLFSRAMGAKSTAACLPGPSRVRHRLNVVLSTFDLSELDWRLNS